METVAGLKHFTEMREVARLHCPQEVVPRESVDLKDHEATASTFDLTVWKL
jgi:hypothetical protein